MGKRIEYIDISKGIAILLVLVNHGYSNINPIYIWNGSFFMQLFFVATGLLYSQKRSKWNIRNKLYRRIFPYMVWGGLYAAFLAVLQIIANINDWQSILLRRFNIFINMNSGPMWFLPTLFFAELLFFIPLKNYKMKIAYLIVLLIIGLFAPANGGIGVAVLRTFIAAFFIGMGYYCKDLFKKQCHMGVVGLILILSVVVALCNGEVILAGRQIGNPILFLISSVLGSYLIIYISRYCC